VWLSDLIRDGVFVDIGEKQFHIKDREKKVFHTKSWFVAMEFHLMTQFAYRNSSTVFTQKTSLPLSDAGTSVKAEIFVAPA
jgi:hypothetical protein